MQASKRVKFFRKKNLWVRVKGGGVIGEKIGIEFDF